jgi:type VI secretion system protein ImpH
MAGARRGQTPPLIERLEREPHRFDSRQAVRVLETHQRREQGAAIRFGSSLSLAFPIGDIESVQLPLGPAQPPVVTVSFFGLGGATGPLPAPFTEHVAAAARRQPPDTAGRDFLDIFNHRLVTAAMDLARLFRPALQRGPPQASNLARQSYALMGLGTPDIRGAIEARAPTLLPLAALVNQRPLSAHAIERAFSARFGIAARVVPFRGDWLRVPAAQRTMLGRRGRNRRLGHDAMLGGKIWDQSAGIVLELGPMPLDEAERLFPAAPSTRRSDPAARLDFLVERARMPLDEAERLLPIAPTTRYRDFVALLDFLVEPTVAIDLRLLVTEASIEPSLLSRPLRLGWNAWLTRSAGPRRSRPDPRNALPPLDGSAAPATRTVTLPFRPVPQPT